MIVKLNSYFAGNKHVISAKLFTVHYKQTDFFNSATLFSRCTFATQIDPVNVITNLLENLGIPTQIKKKEEPN
jgi:hypothetical protein